MGLVFVMMLFQPSILAVHQGANDQVIDYSYANIAIEPKEHQPFIENVQNLREKLTDPRRYRNIASLHRGRDIHVQGDLTRKDPDLRDTG